MKSQMGIGAHRIFPSRPGLQTFVTFVTVHCRSAVKINLKDYLLIKEAAQIVGVSEGTLRNWGRQGKLPTHRHPLNRYRLYKRADLENLLASVHASAAAPGHVDG